MKRPRVTILMYHHLGSEDSVISILPQLFAWQMKQLHRRDLPVVALSDLVEWLRQGRPLPERSVVLTFDDGLQSVYTAGFPILAQYHFPATIFPVTGYCGRWNDWPGQTAAIPRLAMLSWMQMREMSQYGIEFGAHTATHPQLDKLPLAEVQSELANSKSTLEQELGKKVELFAYPYGAFDGGIKQAVSHFFAGACTTRPGMVAAGDNPLALDRVDVYYLKPQILFSRLGSLLLPPYLQLCRLARALASSTRRQAD